MIYEDSKLSPNAEVYLWSLDGDSEELTDPKTIVSFSDCLAEGKQVILGQFPTGTVLFEIDCDQRRFLVYSVTVEVHAGVFRV